MKLGSAVSESSIQTPVRRLAGSIRSPLHLFARLCSYGLLYEWCYGVVFVRVSLIIQEGSDGFEANARRKVSNVSLFHSIEALRPGCSCQFPPHQSGSGTIRLFLSLGPSCSSSRPHRSIYVICVPGCFIVFEQRVDASVVNCWVIDGIMTN